MEMMGVRILGAATVAVAFAAVSTRAEEPRRADAAEQARILAAFDDAQSKLNSFSAAFVQTKRWKAFADETKSEGFLSFAPPGRFRFETSKPHSALTVCNGKRLWMYFPEFKEVEEYSLDNEKSLSELTAALNIALGFQANQLTRNYDAAVFLTDAGYLFDLTPRDPKLRRLFAKVRVWFDREFLAQASEILSANGDSTLLHFAAPKRNEPIPPETFEFKPPAGVEVLRPLEKK